MKLMAYSDVQRAEFSLKEKREFNAFWLNLIEGGFSSNDANAAIIEPGQFTTRWTRGVGYVVTWREAK